MFLRVRFLVFLLISPALALQAQTPPSTPKPSPDVVAGIPVNYDEAKVGTYTLPDPLTLNNGKPVRVSILTSAGWSATAQTILNRT